MAEDKISKPVASEKSLTTAEELALLKEQNKALEAEKKELGRQIINQDENAGIALDAYIEVMSLVPFKLNLSTEKLGRGRQFSFTRFGEVKRILYNDLASIFENYRSFMEGGFFYILNPKVIRKHGLNDIYEKILTKEMIDNILTFEPDNAVKLYEGAGNAQREIIDGMLINKVKNNDPKDIDFNVISQISKIGGRDIVSIAEDMKKLETIEQ